jgi:hypothetical protein
MKQWTKFPVVRVPTGCRIAEFHQTLYPGVYQFLKTANLTHQQTHTYKTIEASYLDECSNMECVWLDSRNTSLILDLIVKQAAGLAAAAGAVA